MKFNLNGLFCVLVPLLIFQACKKSEITSFGSEMQFSTQIKGVMPVQESVALDQKAEIGVYVKKSGVAIDMNSIVAGVDNKRFVTDKSGVFRSEDLSVQYPLTLGADVIAYHPYRRQLQDFRFDIELNDQTRQDALDFMASNNLKSMSGGVQTPELVFERQMAKIHINISAPTGVSLQGLTVVLRGMRTQGFYDFKRESLSTASNSIRDIQPLITERGTLGRFAEVTIFPQTADNVQHFVFTLQSGREYRLPLPPDSAFQKGYRYVYDVVLSDDAEIVKPGPPKVYFETPQLSQSNSNTLYITHMMPENNDKRNYSLLYNTEYKLAYWVAYPLHASYLGTSGRSEAWGFDPLINGAFQSTLFKGFGISNVDRGHQIPSADRTVSDRANATTFYFSNMTAQHSRLNQGLWANLENRIRTWINRTDTLYVVTGAMPTSTSDPVVEYVTDNSGVRVARPKYYYKAVAARTGSSYETIAYRLNNVQPLNNDFTQHSISVEQLEKETGFIFFPTIPDQVKQRVNQAFWQ